MTLAQFIYILLLLIPLNTVISPDQVRPTTETGFSLTVPASQLLQAQPSSDNTLSDEESCGSAIMTDHIVVADVDYAGRTVRVQQRIHFPNLTETDLDQLVLNVEANTWRDTFMLERVYTGRQQLEYTLEGKKLTITLPEVLRAGCEVDIALHFSVDVPLIGSRGSTHRGYFGYTNRQLNLGHWLPNLAPYIDGAWVSYEDRHIGEQQVMELANWDVTVNLVNGHDGISVAAPGTVQQMGSSSWRYNLPAAREFSLSISHLYSINAATSESGIEVEVYSFTGGASAAHALEVATLSVDLYSDLWGPYGYSRILVVEGDFPDGMEFHGLVFVGQNWFTRYTGNPASYLLLITVHEISHQWWYGMVGSNQALHPYLDEALTTYSEYIFLEEHYPDLKDWWWRFRIERYNPTGYVDETIYDADNLRSYINAIYLRGAQMLHALRADLGTDAFFQWLADYADAANGMIATPEDFWGQLTPEQYAATEATRQRFLRQPDVLVSPETEIEP